MSGLQCRFDRQIDPSPQQHGEFAHHRRHAEQSGTSVRQKIHKQVDVAIRPHLPASSRSEQGQLPDPITAAVLSNGRGVRTSMSTAMVINASHKYFTQQTQQHPHPAPNPRALIQAVNGLARQFGASIGPSERLRQGSMRQRSRTNHDKTQMPQVCSNSPREVETIREILASKAAGPHYINRLQGNWLRFFELPFTSAQAAFSYPRSSAFICGHYQQICAA